MEVLRLTLKLTSAIKITALHAQAFKQCVGRIFRSSSMAEHPAVSYLQLPQVTVVEKLGEFRETYSSK
jgi:hypothetical protein